MADLGLGAMANPQPSAEEQAAYRNGWFDILNRPEVSAGLLQFGINALQPVPIQQTTGGAIGGAIGAGAQAYDRSLHSQNANVQQETENAQRAEQLANQRRGQDIQATGNEMDYSLGMAGLGARTEVANIREQGRRYAAELLASGKYNDRTRAAIATYMQYNTDAGPEQIKNLADTMEQYGGTAPATPPASGAPAAPASANPAPASSNTGGIPAYATEALAQEAATAGLIKPGDRISVGGVTGTWK